MNDEAQPRRRKGTMRVILVLLVVIGLVLVLEGALSIGSMMLSVSRQAQSVPVSHRYTAHDRVLGWMVEPNMREADAYGEWRPLTTTASNLRAAAQPAEEPAAGVFRIVCGGGSAVFGAGVADDDTWCSRLGAADPRVEAVNAGQPAYGPGQGWMMLRDRVALKHDLLLFAVSGEDMFKFLVSQDARFPKPRLESGEAGLNVTNTPISRRPYLLPWVTYNAHLFSQSQLLAPLVSRPPPESLDAPVMPATVLMSNLIPALQELAESREATLVVAYLPSHPALERRAEPWRRSLATSLELRGVPFLDLVDDEGVRLNAPPEELLGSEALLSPLGHQRVADALIAELTALDSIEFPGVSGGPWRARYFRDAVFQNQAAERYHGVSSLDWGSGAPLAGLPNDGFSVILDSCLPLDEPRRVRVRLEADGPATFSVNGQTILDTGESEGPLSRVNAVDLPAGGNRLRIRYRDSAERAFVRLLFRFEDGRVTMPTHPLVRQPGSADCGNQPRAKASSEGP